MVEEFSNQIPIYYPYMEKQIYYVFKLTTLIFIASAQTLSHCFSPPQIYSTTYMIALRIGSKNNTIF